VDPRGYAPASGAEPNWGAGQLPSVGSGWAAGTTAWAEAETGQLDAVPASRSADNAPPWQSPAARSQANTRTQTDPGRRRTVDTPPRQPEAGRPGLALPRPETQPVTRRGRGRYLLVALLAVVLLLGGAGVFVLRGKSDKPRADGTPPPAASASAGASAQPGEPLVPSTDPSGVPDKGAGTWAFAGDTGPVLGSAGTVRRYRVGVEKGSGQDAAAFAKAVDAVLGDPKGWAGGGKVRFQRVPEKSSSEVTILLATPATTDQVCAASGLRVQKFLSCRMPGQIVINLARWLTAVPDYGAPLADYQAFALNHEVGRDLGYPNQACPGSGLDAPVMQQQSLGLDGCVANAWPYPHGTLYEGRPIP
jgi:Protein of unknown function (DUF3152)